MTAPRHGGFVARMLAAAIWIAAGAEGLSAQSYSASGRLGYLGEWEITANLARTATASGTTYDGPVTLRHVGLCSVHAPEEKSGVVRLTVSPRTSAIEGTLAMRDDTCRIVTSGREPHSGLMTCGDGQGVPIHLSIDATAGGDPGVGGREQPAE